ncbi:MAG: hypothetical protein HN617_18820 [Planctomycetaceae bacterium]|nr:hypothetical protein [Planctomycetaceae bacterium]
MAFTSDGQFALTTTDRRITTIWDCESLQPRNLPMKSDYRVIAMELDIRNQSLFTIHSDASLRTWKIPADNTIGMDNNNPLLKPSITSTLERFQLMLSVRSTDTGLGVTSAEAKRLLASQPNANKN